MKEDKSPSVVEVQHQIRANASQLQDYFSDLYTWEKNINKEDSARKRSSKTVKNSATPPPRKPRLVGSNGIEESGTSEAKKPDSHTYDKGYKRWEKFDVDAALKEADDEEDAKHEVLEATTSVQSSDLNSRGMATTKVSSSVASKSREELEKEEGNAHYKRGDYVAAIKSYTRCLGYSPQNAVVLSNRAMAYLKNREFANAEDDCTLALKADPTHIKSYSRRGTARNSLGKHRLALLDFHRAATLDPKSRQIQAQLQSTRELVRTAIKRSPKRTEFSIEVVGEPALDKGPTPEEKKENVKSLQQVQSSSDTKQKPAIQESVSDPLPTSKAATVESTAVKKKQSSGILPKLPKMVPVTSYEFNRVWKSLALRGDADQKSALLNLRAEYLRMMNPSTLHTVFKTGMESDVLCEIFHVLREVVLGATEVEKEDNQLALAFSSELTKIPRFNMTIMLLSASEKKDMAWVINHLEADGNIANLKKLYDLS